MERDNKEIKPSKEMKVIQLLQFLKHYTDRHHPASLAMISEYFGRPERLPSGYLPSYDYFGDKNTRNKLIKNVAYAVNSDSRGTLLPENEWKIIYRDFVRDYGEKNEKSNLPKKEHHICDIYYNHSFSYEEIRMILESISSNDKLPDKTKEKLSQKIKAEFTSKFYSNKTYMSPKAQRELEKKRALNERLAMLRRIE